MDDDTFLSFIFKIIIVFLSFIGVLSILLAAGESHPIAVAALIILALVVFMFFMRSAMIRHGEVMGWMAENEPPQVQQPKQQEIHYHLHYHAPAQLSQSGPPPVAWRVAELEQRNEIVVRR
jgi:hypothetical protein